LPLLREPNDRARRNPLDSKSAIRPVAQLAGRAENPGRIGCAESSGISGILLIREADGLTARAGDLRFWRNWPAGNRRPQPGNDAAPGRLARWLGSSAIPASA
jgi:hypothetical protein